MKIKGKVLKYTILVLTILVYAVPLHGQESRQMAQEKSVASDKRTALVIGNAKYTVARSLANPVNDATDMSAALKELGFDVITGTDLTLPQMRVKVREFGVKLKANGGVGLFYYAGHGIQVKGINYLIPVEADIPVEDEIADLAFRLDGVFDKMGSANNGFNIVILDACRNNPFARSWSRSMNTDGLAQVVAPTGTFIAYATSPDNTANDGTGRNGLYTEQLLKFIKKPNNKIEETFKEVGKAVKGSSGGKQNPWLSSDFSGDFYFKFDKRLAQKPVLDPRTSGPLPPVEQVLEKYFQAIGGKAALQTLQTLVRSAEVEFVSEGRKGSAAMVEIWKAPNKQYSEMKLSEGQITQEGFDGTSGWTKSPNGFAQMVGRQLEVKKRTAAIGMTADLATFKQYYTDLRVMGREIINDKETFVIEASGVGRPDILYIDTQTNILVRFDYLSESSQQKGVGVPTQVFFEEYGEVSGFLIPFVVRYAQSNTRIVMRYSTYPVEFNRVVEDSRFQAPLSPGKKLEDNIAELEKARTLLRETDEQYALKNYDKAIELCTKAIQIAPNNANGVNKRGVIYDAKGSSDKAIQDFSLAIKLDPYSYLPYFNRGNSYYKKREYALAIADFSKSIELKPWVTAYSSRAAAYTTIGQHSQALDDYSKAIELEPSKASLYLYRAVVHERMGQSPLAAADRIKYKELGGK